MAATFETELFAAGGNNTGIVVPPEIVEGLGRGKRVPVAVTVTGGAAPYSFTGTTAVMGGRHLVSFSKAHREASGLAAGDPITVTLEVDDAPRTVELPAALAEALAGKPGAEAAFAALAPSKQKAHALSVAEAKTDATRERRVAKVLDSLG